jgi:hypothetical protein
MSNAVENQARIQAIRRRLLSGELSYFQAKVEAEPIIAEINNTAKRLAKKYNLPASKVSFAGIMR